MTGYDPSRWYWIVAGSTTQVWSSAAAAYVPTTDAGYQAWLVAGGTPTRIGSVADLAVVLLGAYPAGSPLPPSVITSLQFLQRFTAAELSAIQSAALVSPPTAASLALHAYLLQLGAATQVDLASPMTKAGTDALVAAGLLTAARETAILTP